MIAQVILYFVLGVISEFLATLFYQSIFQRKPYHAITMNTIIMFLSFFVISNIVVGRIISLIVAYVTGQNLGIILAMKLNKQKKD